MTNSIPSYPSIYHIGARDIYDIFSSDVSIEEKIDGSQFSFGRIGDELWCRSKSQMINMYEPEKMFAQAVKSVMEIGRALVPECIYRAEYLSKPKHNVLAYDRVPPHNLILFDISFEDKYVSYEAKAFEAQRLGLLCVPLLYQGMIESPNHLFDFLDTTSILGGTKIEGVVVKNYSLKTRHGSIYLGKYVSEKFKEIMNHDKKVIPKQDIEIALTERYRSAARWQKAIQHLAEAGALERSPKDIGPLIKEVQADVKAECEQEIKDYLFEHYWPKIQRGIIYGLPEWYKTSLMTGSFEEDD